MKPALPEQTVPASTFMIFQVMFAALTPGQEKKKIILFFTTDTSFSSQLLHLVRRLNVCP